MRPRGVDQLLSFFRGECYRLLAQHVFSGIERLISFQFLLGQMHKLHSFLIAHGVFIKIDTSTLLSSRRLVNLH